MKNNKMKSFKQYISEEPVEPMEFGKSGVIPEKQKEEEEKEEDTSSKSKEIKFGKGGLIPDKNKKVI
jgi:hypothetical protein